MKNIKVKFADQTNKIQVQAADDIDEVLSNLEFDPYSDSRLNRLTCLADLVGEIEDSGHPDIITGMTSIDYNESENDFAWVFSIGNIKNIDKNELDENEYHYKYFILDNEVYVYYSICE